MSALRSTSVVWYNLNSTSEQLDALLHDGALLSLLSVSVSPGECLEDCPELYALLVRHVCSRALDVEGLIPQESLLSPTDFVLLCALDGLFVQAAAVLCEVTCRPKSLRSTHGVLCVNLLVSLLTDVLRCSVLLGTVASREDRAFG
jgi:hypothetical protein